MPSIDASRRLLTAVVACLLTLAPATVWAQDASPEPSPAAPAEAVAAASSPVGSWLVTAFDAWEQGLSEPLPDSRLRLSIVEDGQLQGETACGRFNGAWSGEGSELFAGVAPTGFLDCPDAQKAEGIGLSNALGATVSWQPGESGGIELLDAIGATRLVLQPLTLGDPTGGWEVVRFTRPNGQFAKPLAEYPMTLTLLEDGALEGSTGCRLLLGGYSYDAADIVVGPLEPQGRPCDGARARAERRVLRAFGEATTFEQTGDGLILYDAFDAPVAELIRAAEDGE